MRLPPRWSPRFDGWSRELATAPSPRLPRDLVHKARDENVLVARVERDPAAGDGGFAVQLVFDRDHPFFFEHPVDHVPGLALIEAGRQTGLAVAHLFYDVPVDGTAFFIDELHATFTSFADVDQPVFSNAVVTDVVTKRGRVTRMHFTGHYLQRGRSIGTLTGRWMIVDRAVVDRMRRRSEASPAS